MESLLTINMSEFEYNIVCNGEEFIAGKTVYDHDIDTDDNIAITILQLFPLKPV